MNSSELIGELIEMTKNHISRTEKFLECDDVTLNKITQNQWTILECCEHLNQYFNFYLPEISKKLSFSKSTSKVNFSPGLIGDYFAKSMLPKVNMTKMKSPKDKNPVGISLNKSVIVDLIKNLETLLSLLEQSKSVNLEKVKIKISISKLIQLKLGDTFRFIINHNERHIVQAEKLFHPIKFPNQYD